MASALRRYLSLTAFVHIFLKDFGHSFSLSGSLSQVYFQNMIGTKVLLLLVISWNEWLKLPIKYPDLPRNAQLAFTIWDIYGPRKAVPVGGTTVSLYGKYG